MNKWCKALQEALEGECDKIPKGWASGRELDKVFGSLRKRTVALRRLIKAGRCEVKDFRVCRGSRVRPTPHYFLK